ncbi:hypothetical protein OG895_12290 [Streptomyces sp. NBC_00201]|uniref:hypothetical protein n=1 Tax=Streptomyces sp. NBC_00201 TaxID=2975679 RepID=UPI0022539EC7|nr:hypothetical protein [Streptomyces sp. NBC_00201]MCX5246007.1 hypothetical protein [Streptomyces sp. NBC_00201]
MRWGRTSRDQNSNDARRSQVALLEEQALSMFQQGRTAEAVPLQERAVELVHAIIGAQAGATPDDLVMLGSLQYGLGSSLRAVDRPDDALAALDAAEEAYGDVLDTGRRDMAQRITDVQVRRARTFQELGQVTDSILEMDGVVRAAMLAGPDGDVFEFELGLSRLLYTNALVLGQYGDPDLILSSADAVVRLITSNGLKVNTLEGDRAYYIDVLRCAATIAMREHAGQGRAEIAASAGRIAVDTWVEVERSEFPQLIREMGEMPSMYRISIVRAAAYYGKLTEALGQRELSERYRDFARDLDADVAGRAEQNWLGIGIGPMTMGTALHRARKLLGVGQVPDEVLLLGGPDNARSRFTTSQRCPRSQWADSAGELARVVAPLARHPQLVATLGLEAHLLYASSLAVAEDATAWHVANSRHWMYLLRDLVKAFEQAGDQAICQDLERWMDVTCEVINPFHDPHGH